MFKVWIYKFLSSINKKYITSKVNMARDRHVLTDILLQTGIFIWTCILSGHSNVPGVWRELRRYPVLNRRKNDGNVKRLACENGL